MNAKKIYVKVWRDIARQKWQFVALVVILALGVMIFGGTVGMIGDVTESVDQTLERLAFQDFVVTFEGTVPEEAIEQIARLENVQAVTGRLVMDTGLFLNEDNLARARLVGMPSDGPPPVNQLFIRQGRYLKEEDGLVAVLDAHLADHYDFGPGTVLHPIFGGQQLDIEVVGVATSPEYLMAVADMQNFLPSPSGFAVLFMPQTQMQALFEAPGAINELNVLLKDRSEEAIDAAIVRARSALSTLPIKSVAKREDNPSYFLLMMDLQGGEEALEMVPLMILIVAALSIYVTLSRMVQAQRPQVGVMKAIGYSRRAIMGHYLLFSGFLALAGSIIGIALGYPLGRIATWGYATELGLPFVVSRFHADATIEAVSMTVFFCLLAAFFPARASAKIAPAQAMRFDPSVALVKGSVPVLERFLGRLFPKRLRVRTRIALRNVFRNRRRTFATATGFVFALIILLVCWAMFDAFDYLLEIQFRQTDRWDVSAMWMSPQAPALLDQISSWEGVHEVEPVISLPVTLQSSATLRAENSGESPDTRTEGSFLIAIAPDTTLHGFRLPNDKSPVQVLAPGHGLLSSALGKKLKVETGDLVVIKTPFGSAEMVVDTTNDEVMGANIYTSLEDAQAFVGAASHSSGTADGWFNGLLLKVDPSQWSPVRQALYHLPGTASVSLKEDLITGWRALFSLYYFMMGMFLFFSLLMTAAVIFNTMTVNVLERQREIATMRTLGQSRRQLTVAITLENLIVGVLALVPGLLLGYASAYYIFQAFETEAFTMPLHIRSATFVIVTVSIFLAALLSQVPAVRRVNRLDLAEATKVMT